MSRYIPTEYQLSVFCALALRWLMNRSEACNKLFAVTDYSVSLLANHDRAQETVLGRVCRFSVGR